MGFAPLRVRRIERVRLHADLTILTQLACALMRCRRDASTLEDSRCRVYASKSKAA
jgi:hypothetical protein